MNEAIKLAIESGGYVEAIVKEIYEAKRLRLDITTLEHMPHPDGRYLLSFIDNGREHSVWRIPALDPLFWQVLGKALGWVDAAYNPNAWQWNARRYFDLVLTGGDTSKFWKELLTQNDDEPTQTQPS